MIVRNEIERLEACYRSVEALVTEWVVVDTGSTDGTPELVKRLRPDAKLLSFEWCDHFAKARNFALQHATQAWILSLDADERLHPDSLPVLHRLLQGPPASDTLYFFLSEDIDRQAQVRAQRYAGRLVANFAGWRFKRRIHEGLHREAPFRSLFDPGLRLRHIHDRPHPDKNQLYLKLLQRARQEEPSPHLDYHYANLLLIQQPPRYTEALSILDAALREALAHDNLGGVFPANLLLETQDVLYQTGRLDEAYQRFRQFQSQSPHSVIFAESWALHAELALRRSQRDEALQAATMALEAQACHPSAVWPARLFQVLSALLPEAAAWSFQWLFRLYAQSPQGSASTFLAHWRAHHDALQRRFQQRDYGAVIELAACLLPHFFHRDIFEKSLVAAVRTGAVELAQLLASAGSLLWPAQDFFSSSLRQLAQRPPRSRFHWSHAVLKYVLTPAQAAPVLQLRQLSLHKTPARAVTSEHNLARMRWCLSSEQELKHPVELSPAQNALLHYCSALPPLRQDSLFFDSEHGRLRLRAYPGRQLFLYEAHRIAQACHQGFRAHTAPRAK